MIGPERVPSKVIAARRDIKAAGLSAYVDIQEGDGRLLQVMSNILSNAIKYSPPEADIDIGAEHDEGTARIRVR